MKKFFLLLVSVSVLFVIGCGSGGNSATTSNTSPGSTGEPIAAGMGRISVSFGTESAKQAQAVTLTADHARVVVRKIEVVTFTDPDTGDTSTGLSTTYQGVADGAIPGTISLQVPADTGYQIDVLTYEANSGGTGMNAVVKYSNSAGNYPTGVDVAQGTDTVVTMPALTDCLAAGALSVQASIESGLVYNLMKGGSWSYPAPIRNSIGLVQGTLTDPTTVFAYNASNIYHTDKFTTPASATTVNYWIQGLFFIDLGLLKPSEQAQANKWACYQTATTQLTPPTTVTINFP
jgi:hypothetical protein